MQDTSQRVEGTVPSYVSLALQKLAASAPTRGGFMQASDLPSFQMPSLKAPLAKEGDMGFVNYKPGDFKPVDIMKKSAEVVAATGVFLHREKIAKDTASKLAALHPAAIGALGGGILGAGVGGLGGLAYHNKQEGQGQGSRTKRVLTGAGLGALGGAGLGALGGFGYSHFAPHKVNPKVVVPPEVHVSPETAAAVHKILGDFEHDSVAYHARDAAVQRIYKHRKALNLNYADAWAHIAAGDEHVDRLTKELGRVHGRPGLSLENTGYLNYKDMTQHKELEKAVHAWFSNRGIPFSLHPDPISPLRPQAEKALEAHARNHADAYVEKMLGHIYPLPGSGKVAADITPSSGQRLGASGIGAAAARAKSVGLPRATTPAGPSIAQQAKVPTVGPPLPGATKGAI